MWLWCGKGYKDVVYLDDGMCAVQGEVEERVSHLVKGTLSGFYNMDLKCGSIQLSMLKSSLQIAHVVWCDMLTGVQLKCKFWGLSP